jgi:hypothetical protein
MAINHPVESPFRTRHPKDSVRICSVVSELADVRHSSWRRRLFTVWPSTSRPRHSPLLNLFRAPQLSDTPIIEPRSGLSHKAEQKDLAGTSALIRPLVP